MEHVSPDFAALAAAMPATVKALLVDGADPASVPLHSLLTDLRVDPSLHMLASHAHVMRAPSVLNVQSSAVLREAVDNARSTKVDSVDGAPDHQVGLSLSTLTALVGDDAVRRLCLLPAVFSRQAARAEAAPASARASVASIAGAPEAGDAPWTPSSMFVRRYSSDSRPWIAFHADNAAVTVNVALSDDAAVKGGKLVAVANDQVQTIIRREGEATVHDSRLLHAVSRTERGVRYSLICFFGKREVAEELKEVDAFEEHVQTLPTSQRQRLRSQLEAIEAPMLLRIGEAEEALRSARERQPNANAALEAARRAEEAAKEAVARAQRALDSARLQTAAAEHGARAAADQAARAGQRVDELRANADASRRELRGRILRGEALASPSPSAVDLRSSSTDQHTILRAEASVSPSTAVVRTAESGEGASRREMPKADAARQSAPPQSPDCRPPPPEAPRQNQPQPQPHSQLPLPSPPAGRAEEDAIDDELASCVSLWYKPTRR